MKLPLFLLEDYFKQWEFNAPYLFSMSDAETWKLSEIMEMADEECRILWKEMGLGYTETQGHPLLLAEIAKFYNSTQTNQILTFSGAGEGITCSFKALLFEGDHAIVVTPCYQSLEAVPATLGADVTKVQLLEGWRIDLEGIARAVCPQTKVIVVNFPHNPTGALITQEEQRELVEIARKQGIYLFSDEVYRLLELDEAKRLPPIVDIYERGISLNVMTKAFGMGGLRIGWIAAKNRKFMEEARNVKHYGSISNSCLSEWTALVSLRSKEKLLKRNRELLLKNYVLVAEFFSRYTHLFALIAPQGGCIAFPKLLSGQPIETFAAELVKKSGVLILPGTKYNFPGNYFRIGFGRENLPEVLKRFEEYAASYTSPN